MNISVKQKHIYREQNCGCQGGKAVGVENEQFGISRHKLIYMGWISNKVIIHSTGYSISCDKPQWERI